MPTLQEETHHHRFDLNSRDTDDSSSSSSSSKTSTFQNSDFSNQSSSPIHFLGKSVFYTICLCSLIWYLLKKQPKNKQTARHRRRRHRLCHLRDWTTDDDDTNTIQHPSSTTSDDSKKTFDSFTCGGGNASDAKTWEDTNPSLKVRLSCNPFNAPPPRRAPGMALDDKSGDIYLFGGCGTYSLLGDTHRYSSRTFDWEEIKRNHPETAADATASVIIEPRANFQMVIANRLLVLFGGSTKTHDCTSSLLVMDLSSSGSSSSGTKQGAVMWNDASDCDIIQPAPRRGHAMCAFGDLVVLFGGVTMHAKHLNDLWLFDTNHFKQSNVGHIWHRVQQQRHSSDEAYYWPMARERHCIAVVEDKLVLAGGHNHQTSKLVSPGEIEVYDLHSGRWTCEVTCGDEPPLDHNCSIHGVKGIGKLVTICDREMTKSGIFNRIDVLDAMVNPMCWCEVDLEWHGDWTLVPGWRRYFSSVFDATDGLLFVFGGQSGGGGGGGDRDAKHEILIHNTLIVANFERLFDGEKG